MMPGPPSDEEIVRGLEEGLRSGHERLRVTGMERVPYAYATSCPLEEVTAHLDDGRALHLILKDLTRERLLGDARRSKPEFLYDPLRCIDTYRRILLERGVGARCYGSFADERSARYWLLIEKVPGVELWQIGDLARWESVARWLARFHRSFVGEGEGVARLNAHLLRYGPDFLRVWPTRALAVVSRAEPDGDRLRRLRALVAGYDQVVDRLATVPPTFVHGELYPSNVLVGAADGAEAVWPIDWEMAGIGPHLLDLAALTGGWHGEEQARLVDAYLDEFGSAGQPVGAEDASAVLDCCRLHYALQWLGWSTDWVPPPEHARDWVAEALTLGERLGL